MFVTSENVGSGMLLLDTKKFVEEKINSIQPRSVLKRGDILTNIVGASIGRSAIYDSDDIANINQAVALIRLKDGQNPKYILYVLNSPTMLAHMDSEKVDVARANLSLADVRNYSIPLPPLNEQRRIVTKLEELLAKVDASQQRLAKIPVILKRFRQAVLAAACSGRLTADWREENKVEEWGWSTLSKQDVSVQTGPFGSALHKHDYVSNGVPLINPMHIREGQIFPNADQSVSEAKMKELTRYVLRPGDIVLGRRGEMGRAAVVRVSGLMCGTGSLILRATSKKVVPDFLCLLLRSPYTCAFLEEGSVGSTMTNLNQQVVGSIEFPIVSPDEQQEIVRCVESFFILADQLEARYRSAKTHVDKLTQSILAKAFRGELVPQDPNDEPAAVLLEGIHTSRKFLQIKKAGSKRSLK
jgi:type I restriction enzyme S subunit